MNLEDEITFEHLTLANLTQLINQNIYGAKSMDIRMCWGFTGGKMYGRVYDCDELLFQRLYSGKFTHILLAIMHQDFQIFLSKLNKQRSYQPKRKKEDENKISIGERLGLLPIKKPE